MTSFSVKEGGKPEKRGFQPMRKKLGEKFCVVFSLTVVVTDMELLSTHDYVVSKIGEILGNTQWIHEAVQAAAGLLDPFFADLDAETRAVKCFWKTLKEIEDSDDFTWTGKPLTPPFPRNPLVKWNKQGHLFAPYDQD